MKMEGLDRYNLLDKVIRISNSTVDVERRLKNLLQLLTRELQVDKAVLFSLDREAGTLILRAQAEEGPAPAIRLPLKGNFLATAALQRNTVFQSDEEAVFEDPELARFFGGYVVRIGFPIMDDQVLYGVLALLHRSEMDYGPERTALIETISREIAGTIRNSRLYRESKKRIADLSVLYEVGRAVSSSIDLNRVLDTVVNITCKVLLAEGCALNVFNAATNRLEVAAQYGFVPPGCRLKDLQGADVGERVGDLRACVGRENPYLGPASGDDACPCMREYGGEQSVICLPLHFKGKLRGVLSVYNKVAAPPGRPREFNREDLELLNTMGAMISSSVENAMTFQAVDGLARRNEQLVRDLSLLYEISGAMMTTVKTDELLAIITTALVHTRGLNFDRAMILLMNEEEDALVGAALREIRPEERANGDQDLSEALRGVLAGDHESAADAATDLELPLSRDGGILVRTALEKKTFTLSPENSRDPDGKDLPEHFGRSAFATVPMLAKGKVVGVIAVDRDFSAEEIQADDIRKLSMLANQAGLALENSRLYEYIEQANLTLSQTRERLIEAEKLAALGEMAAGMAHEIRNPLVSIGGFTRRLLKNLDEDSPHRVYVEVIINEVGRLEKTLGEILDFSRDTMGQLEEVDINEVAAEALYILRREFRECGIEVVKEFGDTPLVLADVRQIKHVFFNLFYNACQAMESGGGLSVKTYATNEGDRAFVATEVSDTGPGIAPEILTNIFNPFFTTKDAGTGLGLSIVHKIVGRHHGEIDVVNSEEGGATFVVKLPVAAQAGVYLK